VSAVREWAAQCHGVDTGPAAQCLTVEGMASPGELAEHRRDMIPRRVRRTARRGFIFDPGACKCQNIKCPCRGSRYRGGEPVRSSMRRNLTRGGNRPSSEAEPHPRGRLALERGGLTRGGDQPSSEAEIRQCGVAPLQRSGVSPEGGWADHSGGPLGPPGPWARPLGRDLS
jgi:hypothetical protein